MKERTPPRKQRMGAALTSMLRIFLLPGGIEALLPVIFAISRFDPVDVLRYAIEELGHSQAELADILGSRSRASEVAAPLP